MKKIIFILALSLFAFNCSKNDDDDEQPIDLSLYTYVPDDKFEEFLIGYGYDDILDNYVLNDNIKNVTILTLGNTGYGVIGHGIRDLTGIGGFKKLEIFALNGLGIQNLDLSNNIALKSLKCEFNTLTILDLSNNTALERLECRYNEITVLDLSNNPSLSYLSCDTNKLITLNVGQCLNLKNLSCWDNNIPTLDISNCIILENLNCASNQLTSLDVSNNTSLRYLNCHSNQFTCITVNQEQLDDIPYNWLSPGQGVIYSTICN